MTAPKPISQAANAAAERYFAMRKNSPDHADRSLAEIIQSVYEDGSSDTASDTLENLREYLDSRDASVSDLKLAVSVLTTAINKSRE